MSNILEKFKEKIKITTYSNSEAATVRADVNEVKSKFANLSKVKENIKRKIKDFYYAHAGADAIIDRYLQEYAERVEQSEFQIREQLENTKQQMNEEFDKIEEQKEIDPLNISFDDYEKTQREYEKLNDKLEKTLENRTIAEDRLKSIQDRIQREEAERVAKEEKEQQLVVASDIKDIMTEDKEEENTFIRVFNETKEEMNSSVDASINEILNGILKLCEERVAKLKGALEQKYANGMEELENHSLDIIEAQKQAKFESDLNWQQKNNALMAAKDEAERNHEAETASLKESHQLEISKLQEQHELEMKKQQEEKEAMKLAHQLEIEKLKNEHQAEYSRLQTESQSKIRDLELKNDNLTKLLSNLEEKNRTMDKTIELQKEKISTLEEMNSAKEKEILTRDRQISLDQNKIAGLEANIEQKDAEISNNNTVIAQKNNEIASLLPYKQKIEALSTMLGAASVPTMGSVAQFDEESRQKTL